MNKRLDRTVVAAGQTEARIEAETETNHSPAAGEVKTAADVAGPDGQQVAEQEVLGQYIPLLYHYNMLLDEDRVGAFQAGIQQLVKPGMHVVELGGGTGILSSFAARQGADVTCVERNPELVQTATRFLRANGLDDRVQVVQADAAQFTPSRPVDVVVCEMLHVGLLREKQAEVIAAFKRNYLQAHAGPLPRFMPEVSILLSQPVQQDFTFAGYNAPVPLFQAPVQQQPRTTTLAELETYDNLIYAAEYPLGYRVRRQCQAHQPGTWNAIRLATQNVMTLENSEQGLITWANQCLVLPLERPVQVQQGDVLEYSFEYQTGQQIDALQRTLRVACHAEASRHAA